MQTVKHTLQPVYNQKSTLLILGTMPSPKSRELNFYYMHPQNRFWKTLSCVFESPVPITTDEKIRFLHKYKIALWDVLARCDINGASDSSITNPIPNDIKKLLDSTSVKYVFTTGKKATELYERLCYPQTKIHSIYLPSPSAANRGMYPDDKLVQHYEVLRKVHNKG